MNYLLIMVLLAFIWRMITGYRHGMVKELKVFINFLVSSVLITLICRAVNAYLHGAGLDMVVAILILIILGIGFKVIKIVFFSAETIVKLPIVHFADKILGIAAGAAEVLAVLWAAFLVLDMLDSLQLGIFAKVLAAYIKENDFLLYLYNHNFFRQLFIGNVFFLYG